MQAFKLEDDINDYIKKELENLGLVKNKDFNIEGKMSDSLKNALKNASKTENKASFGRPDFSLENYHAKDNKENIIPVVIENKLYSKFLKALNSRDSTLKSDETSISKYAVNGALHYAKSILRDKDKYKECIAIGIAGDDIENILIEVYYVFASGTNSHKLTHASNLHFLENQQSFDDFYKECTLSEEEKHLILIKSKEQLNDMAKKLNRLMHNHNITAPQRVLYVSGMLLSMQEIKDKKEGLKPSDLKGHLTDTSRDSVLIVNQIGDFLSAKSLDKEKRELMLASFKEISKDPQRDKKTALDKAISTHLAQDASITKQIFSFLYEFVHKPINESDNTGHLDIMGELYSEFLKYALGDGKELGIVLTPPYVTKMMSQLLGVNANSKVMDLAAGSAGFLISSMVLMIEDIEKAGKNTTTKERIEKMKKSQLLGVELNAEMFSLATTNMILRGDGSSLIIKGNTFETNAQIFKDFKPDILLLNPPFSYEQNGMPFIKFGLEHMQKGGLGAIIIQDSAGSGQALQTNKEILKKHTLIASIKMPTDLFMPMAGVQTSIYIFKAHIPHDYEKLVKFIDFRNDGFKRTKRGLNEISEPFRRYNEIIQIYKAGLKAQVSKELWGDLEKIYTEDFIAKANENKHAKDFNFEAHQKNETKPALEDFKKTISDYLAYEVSLILKSNTPGKS
ncbi:HsdM family class I SAM-dependent methyltransferase [Helicobacter cetorum]|uniref:HsdM family class I SAM-dependent methyltransferase n=1 Tax=Helicobacter cetorum TaxID=138563 RepID=UPI000CF0CDE4|nr:N-6 DNA methylase [Helicobacter cetorum]